MTRYVHLPLVLAFLSMACGSGGFGFTPVEPTPTPPAPPPPGWAVDTFTQEAAAGGNVDIVWVIDDSGSMDGEKEALANSSVIVTETLMDAGVDFRMGIISVMSPFDGRLDMATNCQEGMQDRFGNRVDIPIPDGIIDNAILESQSTVFTTCVDAMPTSGGAEQGMEAARRALDPAYVNGAMNPTFRRDNADLHVIFVSDEEDHPDPDSFLGFSYGGETVEQADVDALFLEMTSELADGGTDRDGREAYFPLLDNHAEFFSDYMTGSTGRFVAHAIVKRSNTPGDCDSAAEVGQRYMTFSEMTGGTISDLCGDWTETMDTIALETSGVQRCFPLSAIPVSETIEVKIDDVAQSSSTYYYGFSLFGPKLCFDTPPSAGSVIEVRYEKI